jgi:hypothetical protein
MKRLLAWITGLAALVGVAFLCARVSVIAPCYEAQRQRLNQNTQKAGGAANQKAQDNQKTAKAYLPMAPDAVTIACEKQANRRQEHYWESAYFRVIRELAAIRTSNKLLIIFNGLLVVVGYLQVCTIRDQAKIMNDTREIAVAALGRANVFFEFVSHNFSEWRDGKKELYVRFRIRNHGEAPAIILKVYGYLFLSYGPYATDDFEGKIEGIRPFIAEGNLLREISSNSNVFIVGEDDIFDIKRCEGTFVLPPGAKSKKLEVSMLYPALRTEDGEPGFAQDRRLYAQTAAGGPLSPWLFGRVYYDDTRGRSYYSSFCVSCRLDGQIYEYEEEPYTKRT